jgi:hypothetical protein
MRENKMEPKSLDEMVGELLDEGAIKALEEMVALIAHGEVEEGGAE